MEKNSSEKGFELKDGKIPIFLVLRKIEDLKPHEETVSSDLQGIIKALERNPIVRHPVIADSATGAVLDGTHRLAALSQMGAYSIPTALIDYQSPLVKVDRWFRGISGKNLRSFRKKIEKLAPFDVSPLDADRGLIDRSTFATLRSKGQCLAFKSPDSRPLQLARDAFRIEQIARRNGLKIVYRDNADLTDSPDASFVMSTIRVEKKEVLESCMNRNLFPPKTTRHIIPSRPLGVGVPLAWLHNKNIGEAEATFLQHLRSKNVKRLPEGSWVGSRRYLEEVFLFE